ncbi:MAG TPA: NifB/NifX family molybdenum-iron cluster-binding protein [Bacillota bacterium]|nr:NifB/NifX family molybdenum-iron cluster-binding protein [Bacillota bacterium]
MAYNIAVASNDGESINQHFGRATRFYVYQVNAENYTFVRVINTNGFCSGSGHDENRLVSLAEGLEGCRAVLVSQIGLGAAKFLKGKGIDSFDVQDFIHNALKKLIKYYAKIDGGKQTGQKN